jgi:hypothetical protein
MRALDRPTTLPAAELRRHFEETAARVGAEVCYDVDSPTGSGMDFRHFPPRVHVVAPYDVASYFIAMHELGHVATLTPDVPHTIDNVAHYEAEASDWAEVNAIVDPGGAGHDALVRALETYVGNGYTIPDDLTDPFWSLISPDSEEAERMRRLARSRHARVQRLATELAGEE